MAESQKNQGQDQDLSGYDKQPEQGESNAKQIKSSKIQGLKQLIKDQLQKASLPKKDGMPDSAEGRFGLSGKGQGGVSSPERISSSEKTPDSGEIPSSGKTPDSGKSPGNFKIFLIIGAVLAFAILLSLILLFALGTGVNNPILRVLNLTQVSFKGVLLTIINVVFGIAAMIAFVSLVVSGFLYVASVGDAPKAKRAKRALIGSTIALVVLLFIYVFLYLMLGGDSGSGSAGGGPIVTIPSPATGAAPFEVTFDVSRIALPGAFYEWDFGDGGNGLGPRITHIYTKAGIFKVTVNETKPDGSKSSENTRVSVTSVRPATVIRASVTEGEVPLKVDFDGGESQVSQGRIVSYEWDFGDISSKENIASGKSVNHTFELRGDYTVTLTTENESGDKNSAQTIIKALEAVGRPNAKIVTSPDDPQGNAPLKIRFNGSGSNDDDGVIESYKWDFGDGSMPAKTARAEHVYDKPGEYSVELTVTDNDGNEGKAKATITVLGEKTPPKAVIDTEPKELTGPVPYQIIFNASKSKDPDGQIVDFLWSFDDNTPQETTPVVTHTFDRIGVYKVKLVVTDNDDLKATKELQIKAIAKKKVAPSAVIETDVNSGVTPLDVSFDASKSYDVDGEIISYRWDFGDGTPSVQGGARITHMYERIGMFNAALTVFDSDNLSGEATTTIAVNRQQPVAKIKAAPTKGQVPLSVEFDSQGSLGNLVRYQWDFGDGVTKSGPKQTHKYQNAGIYEVVLKVFDAANVTDEESVSITVTSD